MRTSEKVLVKRNKAAGHEETVVHVNWAGLTDDDIKLIAAFHVRSRFMEQLRRYERQLPESVEVYAKDFLHLEPVQDKKYAIPDSWKSGTDKPEPVRKAKKKPSLEDMLAGLSKEELITLLGGGE